MALKMTSTARLFLTLLLSVTAHHTHAQPTPLPVPKNIQKAYSIASRNPNGQPGKNYWQNQANYLLKLNFDPATRNLTGLAIIDYTNNSPDTLKKVGFKLYPNLYQKQAIRTIPIAAEDQTDGVLIKNILIDNTPYETSKISIRGTNMTIRGQKIPPHTHTQFEIAYSYTLNKGSFNRTGQIDTGAYFIAYSFPRIAVYDDIDGWNEFPYTGQYEFYNDYCNFQAEITVPGAYQVWATGDLQNPDEVYTPEYANRIRRAATSDTVIDIIRTTDLLSTTNIIPTTDLPRTTDIIPTTSLLRTDEPIRPSNAKTANITKNHPTNTWKFQAGNVTDLAFGISNHYVWKAKSLIVDSTTKRRTQINTVFNPDHPEYLPIIDYATRTVDIMSFTFPRIPYPYSHMTIFDGPDEMEFPMMVDNNPFKKKEDALELTAHEVFHTLFPFYVGINETKYSFMDEGWATMTEFTFPTLIDSTVNIDYDFSDAINSAGIEQDLPIMTLTPQLMGAARYSDKDLKPALGYFYLKEYLGDKLFLHALDDYIQQWKGRHPTPYDFFNCFNTAAGTDLNWFWKNWFFEKNVPDLAISALRQTKNDYTVVITNKGTEIIPIHLHIFFKDGNTQTLTKDIGCWRSGNKTVTLHFSSPLPVQKLVLGNREDLDIDKTNNTWPK